MTKTKIRSGILICIILAGQDLMAQIFTVANGTSMTIQSGTTFSADNMTLVPTTDFTLTNVGLTHNTTVANTTSATCVSRVYKFSATTDAYSGTVRVDYLVGELNGLDEATLQVNAHTGIAWNTIASATNNTSSHYAISNAIAGVTLNEIALGDLLHPLPVELTSFSADQKMDKIHLAWSTATEINNFGFDIERCEKAQGKIGPWEKIGFMEGHGTTNAQQFYRYVDSPVSGTLSYRLKQIDRDGKFAYSKEVDVVTAGAPSVFALSQNFPNPFNPTTNISFTVPATGHATMTVLNILGQEVAVLFKGEAQAGIYNRVQFNGSGLASGIYFSRLEYVGNVQLKKMILAK